MTTEVDRDRLDPFGTMGVQIGGAQGCAVFGGKSRDRLGQPATVEGFAVGAGDVFERIGLVGKAPDFTGDRRTAVGHEGAKTWISGQLSGGIAPLTGNDRADRKAVACVTDGVPEQVLKGEVAEFF